MYVNPNSAAFIQLHALELMLVRVSRLRLPGGPLRTAFSITGQQRKGSAEDRGKGIRPAEGDPEQPKGLGRRVIPGVIAGAAALDPAAVLTATVAGASFGLSVGWVVLL